MNRIKKLYAEEWLKFKTKYFKYFVIQYLLFIGAGVITYIALSQNPEVLKEMLKEVIKGFEGKKVMGYMDNPTMMAIMLFINNTVASAIMYLFGFIPIVIIPALMVLLNGAVIGVVMAAMNIVGQNVFLVILGGILPHGVFEITAFILAAGMGTMVSVEILKYFSPKLVREQNLNGLYFKNMALDTAKTFLFVVFPLLAIAGIIEGFVTPQIIELLGINSLS